MAAKTYNPYDDIAAIVDAKASYNTAKAVGNPNYKQYQEGAKQYYSNLVTNGYGSVSDQLAAVDYDKAKEILANYTKTKPYDDLYTNLTATLTEEASEPKYSKAAADMINGYKAKPNSDRYGKLTEEKINEASNPKYSTAVQEIIDLYNKNDSQLGKLNTDHYDTGKTQLDYLNNFDVTQQSYYDSILGDYKLKGGDAAQGEYASGAANNSGNIDSYAAANANRQQLAYTNAGVAAALNQANQNQTNWQALYDSMGGNLYNNGVLNQGKLDAAANLHGIDSAERQNALNQSAALAGQEKQSETEEILARLGYGTTMYQNDSAERQNALNQSSALAGQESQNKINEILAKLGYESAERQNTENNTANRTIQEMINASAERQNSENNYTNRTIQERLNEANKEIERIRAETERQQYANKAEAEAVTDGSGTAPKVNVINVVESFIDMIGNGEIENLNDVRNAAIIYCGEENADLIDAAIQNYIKYAGKGKNGLPIAGSTQTSGTGNNIIDGILPSVKN